MASRLVGSPMGEFIYYHQGLLRASLKLMLSAPTASWNIFLVGCTATTGAKRVSFKSCRPWLSAGRTASVHSLQGCAMANL
jgi:hypothetical protein